MRSQRPTVPEAFRKIVKLLDDRRVPYLVIGGIGVSLQGEPKTTRDVDLMILLRSQRVPELAEAAKAEGFDIEPELAETQWLASGFIRLWLGPKGKQTAVDLMACNSEYLREVAFRGQQTRFCGHRVAVASPEDLILFKLSAWREKDVPDVRAVYRRHQDHLDVAYLRKWAAWFAAKNPCFAEMPARLEALLGGHPLPPGKPPTDA